MKKKLKKLLENFLLTFLKVCAKIQLKKSQSEIIGITGSAGKTSAVQAVATVLSPHFKVFATKKGNSETGIPLEILGIEVKNYQLWQWLGVLFQSLWQLAFYWPKIDITVIEMAIDSNRFPKNMKYLLSLVKPSIGVVLNINAVHAANFSSKQPLVAIAKEKAQLLNHLPATGTAIYSIDYPQLTKEIHLLKKLKKITFSQQKQTLADIFLNSYSIDRNGTQYNFIFKNKEYQLKFIGQLLPKVMFGTFAAALAIADLHKLNISQAIENLQNHYHLPPSRMSIFPGINGSTIIDSSYNSSLEPALSALEMMDLLSTSGKKIAILGDMRELGERAASDHHDLAQKAVKVSDVIIFVGPLTKKYAASSIHNTKKSVRVFTAKNAKEAIKIVKPIISDQDLILIKGSQNTILLEIVVESLLSHPKEDTGKLCRRGKYWQQQRQLIINSQ